MVAVKVGKKDPAGWEILEDISKISRTGIKIDPVVASSDPNAGFLPTPGRVCAGTF